MTSASSADQVDDSPSPGLTADHPGVNELFAVLAYGEVAAFYRLTDEARMAPDLRGRISMASMAAAEMQRRFALVRMRFNDALSQFDLFSEVITQRSEHETGVWVAGLDDVAADALALPGDYFKPPPIICYLDRGIGAAIRRARTRLPGGGSNPVAIIRVPRERMVGSGVASSLIHEVGHQAAALLDLTASLRQVLQSLQRGNARDADIWYLWERWIAEIVADLWSVARVGIGSTPGPNAMRVSEGTAPLPRPS